MASLINLAQFPQTVQLFEAVDAEFAKGIEAVSIVKGTQIVGTFLSRDAAQRALARKVAEQWLAHPEILEDLERSLEEKPNDWD